MHYIGGKYRIATDIARIINSIRFSDTYIEPFCGACWVTQYINKNNRLAYDSNKYLIELWKALQTGWVPPTNITEQDYYTIKESDADMALKGFVGIGLSFSGKWFGGYSRDPKSDRNFSSNARNSLLLKIKYLRDVQFGCKSYFDVFINGTIIYADPPYEGTTQSGYLDKTFDSDRFWTHTKLLSESNVVVVSEYKAPEEFVCIANFATKTDMKISNGEKDKRLEKLFVHESNLKHIEKISLF